MIRTTGSLPVFVQQAAAAKTIRYEPGPLCGGILSLPQK